LFMVLSGLVKIETMKKLRAIVLICILTLSALLTPPDIFSQLLMAIPTYLLFELSLFMAGAALRSRKNPATEPEEKVLPVPASPTAETEFFPRPPETPESEGYLEHYKHQINKGGKRKLRYTRR
ncbi:MAG: twin-arginine translocase subunit TatC, partial [Victivallales bacterium]|nr:twin-arginine translocase subunit TatC [Victivallales bacterium]